MNWSKQATLTPTGQNKIRLKTKYGEMGLTNLEMNQVGQTVSVSRLIIAEVIGWLSWPLGMTKTRLDGHMARYFLTPGGGPSNGDIRIIISKLELTLNGINSKINVKVAPDPSAYGYVGFKTGVGGALRGLLSSRHNFGTRGGKMVSRGDIHLDKDTLGDTDLAIITFIHEATHKYASTADHGDSGYLENTGNTFDAPGLTKAQALNNADSFAWFCFAAKFR